MSAAMQQAHDEQAPQDPQAKLRDDLAALVAPSVDPQNFAQKLDDAIGGVLSILQMAKTPSNSLEADKRRALMVAIAAGDAVAPFTALKAWIEELENQAKEVAAAAERAVRDVVLATGDADCDTHHTRQKKPKKRVKITDPNKLPMEVFTTPPMPKPTPSKERVRARLISGLPCEGAEWEEGEPEVEIVAKKVSTR